MSILDLRSLYQLHEIEATLMRLQAQVRGLDIGQEEATLLKAKTAQESVISGNFHTLHQEQKDLELKQADMIGKAARFEKDLYSGKIVNSREVEAFQKEIVLLKKHANEFDDRLLELMEELPPIEAESKNLQAEIKMLNEAIARKRELAVKTRDQIQIQYDQTAKRRPEAMKEVSPSLLAKYETIKKQHQGTGMALVKRDRSCDACGMLQADRTITHLLEGQIIQCESCKRILYYTEGAI